MAAHGNPWTASRDDKTEKIKMTLYYMRYCRTLESIGQYQFLDFKHFCCINAFSCIGKPALELPFTGICFAEILGAT